jgi:quercetin dioxygenase-like cupin family protein
MKRHDLGIDAVNLMVRHNLATVDHQPESAIGEFEFHGCTGGVGCFAGQPPWECHTAGDELLLVLAGDTELTVIGEATQQLRAGDMVIVPGGRWHRNDAPSGVTIFHLTPTEGNEHSWQQPQAASASPPHLSSTPSKPGCWPGSRT